MRTLLVTPDAEDAIYAVIVSEAKRLGCGVFALGGIPDHVHLVVKTPTKVSAFDVMQRVKGVWSAFARNPTVGGQLFQWQEGYGVFSVGRSHLSRVVGCVENRKRHHARGKLGADWENPEAPDDATRSGFVTTFAARFKDLWSYPPRPCPFAGRCSPGPARPNPRPGTMRLR